MQVAAFVQGDGILRRSESKQALLAALRPRDTLRLLGLVRALKFHSASAPHPLPRAAPCMQTQAFV